MLLVAFPWIRRIYADRGYLDNFIEEAKHDFGIDVEITHSNYSGQFVPAKKRWVVERTFAWLENFRRLCRNYEETTESANEMLNRHGATFRLATTPDGITRFRIHFPR
ncbi:MAG: transposase [Muribaculaceae bacterium]|nr:transposase [Muribaculaceae bacterium]